MRNAHLKSPTIKMRTAAADRAVVDIVTWLAESECDRICRVETLGGHVSDTFGKVDTHANRLASENSDLSHLRTIIPGHFWCAILADLSGAAESVDDVAPVPQMATRTLLASSENPEWGAVHRFVTGFTVTMLWNYAKPLVTPWDLENLIRVMRILAVLICPDPARHARVARLCLVPLAKDAISGEAENRLRQGFENTLDEPAESPA